MASCAAASRHNHGTPTSAAFEFNVRPTSMPRPMRDRLPRSADLYDRLTTIALVQWAVIAHLFGPSRCASVQSRAALDTRCPGTAPEATASHGERV
jgi:hypothetical protein